MGLFDSLSASIGGLLGQAEGQAASGILAQALGSSGALQGILNQFEQSGLGAQVSSWLGNGPNQPISIDQVRAALGNHQLQQLAAQFGLPVDQVEAYLAQHLPAAVDQSSPNGTLQTPPAP